MFGIFKKKQPTVMDGVIRTIYGDNPPNKSADLERAITIAHEDLLAEQVPISEVGRIASALSAGPIPYSTYDLSVATTLSFFKNPELFNRLKEIQLGARVRVLNWMKEGKVAPGVLKIFEDTLYRVYKPSVEPADRDLDANGTEYTGGLANAVRFTEAALQWTKAWGVIGDVKAICKTAGIEAEHTRAVNALFGVNSCVMKLMQVRDYNEMLEQEHKLFDAAKNLMDTMQQLSEVAHVRRVDVSATAPILESLGAVLKSRGMLKQ
jgi:hypothetical protein